MGVHCLRVALCFAAASALTSCDDGSEQCISQESSLLQHASSLLRATHTHSEEERWAQAAQEEGLEVASISEFGRAVPKIPRSVVARLAALRRETPKRHTYNFVGRLRGHQDARFAYGFTELTRRAWVIPFVLHNFSDHDFFKVTDSEPWFSGSLGKYDHSSEKRASPGAGDPDSPLDPAYFEALAASNFTLCPGGDAPWSIRTYEAAAMGSICLIRDPEQDWNPAPSRSHTADSRGHMARLWGMYRYQRLDEPKHVFDPDVADHNLRVFMRYQTFMEGDNTPPPPGADAEV